MRARVWLGWLALAVGVLAGISFGISAFNHAFSVPVYVSLPLGALAIVWLMSMVVIPTLLGRLGPQRVLPPPGPAQATGRCGAHFGKWLDWSRGLAQVTVYSDRLTLRLVISGEYTVHGSDIRSITRKGPEHDLIIDHTGPGRASPLELMSLGPNVSRAISRIRRDPAPALPDLPADSWDRAARKVAWTTFATVYVLAFALGVGLVGYGVVQLTREPGLFHVVLIVLGLGFIYKGVRRIIRHSRRGS